MVFTSQIFCNTCQQWVPVLQHEDESPTECGCATKPVVPLAEDGQYDDMRPPRDCSGDIDNT